MLGTSKSIWGFDPRNVPGCSLWLDAADSSTITGTTSVTAWTDKSGRGNNAVFTGTNPSYTPANKYVETSNLNQRFSVPAATLQQTTGSGSIFLVYGDQQTQGGSYSALFSSPLPAQSFCQSLKRPDSYSYQFNNSTAPTLTTLVNAINTTNTLIYVMNYTYNSTTGSIRINGTTCVSSFNSSPTPSGALTISSSGWGDGANVRLYEIITFVNDTALTTLQQQQIEGYLAHKWGLVAPSPTIPLSVPGCQLWLDGADPAGTGTPPADGATVSTWVDKSGNGYNATAAPSRTAGTYSTSFRAVNFPNSTTGYITNYSAAPTNETMFVVFNNPSPSGNNNIIIGGVSGARSLGAGFTAAGTGTVGNLNTQIAWLASTGPYTAGTTVFTTSQFTPSSNSVSLNGGTFSTGGAPGFTAGRVTYLGVDATSPVYYYIGYAMEILFYNSILTTTQRQTIETYLAKKWSIGSTSMIPSSHPFYSIRPHLRAFRPTDVPGCQLWLDAADATTVVQSSGSISQWNDKSASALTATAVNNPTLVANVHNGLPGVSLNGSNQYFNLGNNLNMGTNQLYMFVVSKFNTTADGAVIGKSLLGGGVGRYSLLRVSGILTPLAQGTGGGNDSGVNSDTNTSVRILNMIWDRNTITLYQNGTSVFSVGLSDSSSVTNNNSLLIGAYQNGSGGTPPGGLYMNGFIHEILLYFTPISSPLTTSQRQQVEGYLAHKWGLIASFTNPLSIPGCALWLDAADATTITGTTTVTQWRDKSGNARHLGVGSGNTSYSSNAIQLANSYMLVTTPVDLTKVTVFIVVRTAGGSNKTVLTGRPQTSFNWHSLDGFGFYMDNQDGVRFYGQEQSGQFSGFTVNSSTPQVFSFQSIGTSVSGWYNGIPQSGGTLTSPRTSTAQGFAIGGEWYDGAYGNVTVNASIYEVIVYNSDVSTLQRQTIETYLAKKWGIGSTSSSSLASTHPFKSFPPATVFLSFSLITDNLIVSLDPLTYVASSTSWQTVGNTWTLTSPATIVSTGGGVALSLTSQQSITDTTGISTGPASTNNFTIELWFNAPGNSTNNLISEVNGGWNTTMMYLENNTIRAGFWNGGAYSFSMGAYSANTWTQACYTYSGTTVRCYVNGVFVSTDSTTKQYPGVANYRLATTGWPVLSNTAVIIGGFRIYSTALSAADVKQNYNAYASRFGLNTL